MDALKDIVQVLATNALLWTGRPPSQLLLSPTPTQPLAISIPTVTVYPPSRCLPLRSYPSMPGAEASDGQIFIQMLVLFFGLSIFGFFSLGLGAFCLSLHGTQDSAHLHTSPSSEASTTVDRAIDRVAEVRTEPELDDRQTIQELSAKIQNLGGQIMGKAAEIKSLEYHHEYQLASVWSVYESQKSHWAATQRALEVEGQNTVADLRAKIAQLEQQVDRHDATVEQLTADRQRELETARSSHHSALQTIQKLSVKIQNLDGQITVKAAEIKSIESHHEYQMASTWSILEGQKSHWAAAQRALEVEGQNTVADLRGKIAGLEEQVDSHNATVEQIAIGHQTELETVHSNHHSNLQTLIGLHKDETTRLANDLEKTRTRLENELNRARSVNQLLGSFKASLDELKSSQSTTISELKVKLEATSNQLKDAIQEKASVQDRLAAVEGEVESIRTRLYDAEREHTAVVRQKDDMITKNAEIMTTLRLEHVKQQGRAAQLASQMQLLKAEVTTKDTESSLSSATSRIVHLEAQNASKIPASADAVTHPDVFDDEDASSEVDVEGITSASSASSAGPLTRSHSMTSLSPTSSPDSLRRRHSANVVIERAKQVVEEVATAPTENLGGAVVTGEAAVERVMVQNADHESPEPSRNGTNETETKEPSFPELGLSASMWATSRPPAQHKPPPQVDWAAEAARARKGHNEVKKNKNAAQRPRGEPRRPRGGPGRQDFATATFSTSERFASGKAGQIKTTKNGKKDVRQISNESEYKRHDDRG